MRQAWHIFKKDVRHLWIEISVVAAMSVVFAWTRIAGGDPSAPYRLTFIPILLMVAAMVLMARVIHAEPLPGTNQFWITRPYRWKSLMAAKFLFIIAFANVPLLLARLAIIAAAGFPIMPNLAGLIWSHAVFFFVFEVPIVMIAALTPGMMSFILTTLVVAFVQINVIGGAAVRFGLLAGPVAWIGLTIVALLLVVLTLPVATLQYQYRWTRFGRAVGIAGFILLLLVIPRISYTSELDAESRISRPLTDTSSLQIGIDPARLPKYHGLVPPSPETKFVELNVPIAVDGIPEGQELQFEALAIQFDTADGKKNDFGLAAPLRSSRATAREPVFLRDIYVDSALYNAERDRPGIIHATVYFTVFGNPKQRTVQLHQKPENLTDGLQCYKNEEDRVRCRAAIRWPRQLIEAKIDSYIDSIGPLDYSPFPGAPMLDTLMELPVGPPLSGQTMNVTILEPLAHIRRYVEARNIRLADLAAVTSSSVSR